jgi:HEPN domain-containing protein
MPHEADARRDAALWLEYAIADLAIAQAPLPARAKYELLLFHAQQAAEKAMKAVLVSLERDFPFTHSLPRLVELLPDEYHDLPLLLAATVLTEYAVLARYPGEIAPVDESRYQRLADVAAEVVRWAERQIVGE